MTAARDFRSDRLRAIFRAGLPSLWVTPGDAHTDRKSSANGKLKIAHALDSAAT
jgi:hypothetical protein